MYDKYELIWKAKIKKKTTTGNMFKFHIFSYAHFRLKTRKKKFIKNELTLLSFYQ